LLLALLIVLAKSKGAAHDVAKVRRRGVSVLGSDGDGGAPSTFLGIAAGAGPVWVLASKTKYLPCRRTVGRPPVRSVRANLTWSR